MINQFIILFASLALQCLEFLFFARAVMSWFVQGSSKIYEFLYLVTEPIVLPFRKLFEQIGGGRGFPLDIPYFAAFMVIIMLQTVIIRL